MVLPLKVGVPLTDPAPLMTLALPLRTPLLKVRTMV